MNEDRSSNGSEALVNQLSWLEKLGQFFGQTQRNREHLITELQDAHERGMFDADALAMAQGALEMGELQVRDVMIPRSQMITLNKDHTALSALPEIIKSGHSRFPVVGGDKDEVVGVLLAKDLLRCFTDNVEAEQTPDHCLETYIRPAAIIPESKRLNVLLRDFRGSRNHMAIVVDEYGGVSGLVTIEDVLEEIVGDIGDETDSEEMVEDIQRLTESHFRVQALTEIDDFNNELGSQLSDDDYDTVGGIVVAEFGRVPDQGESIELQGLRFEVGKADDRRIHELDVHVLGIKSKPS